MNKLLSKVPLSSEQGFALVAAIGLMGGLAGSETSYSVHPAATSACVADTDLSVVNSSDPARFVGCGGFLD